MQDVQSPHTTAFYVDESRRSFGNEVLDAEQSYGIPGYKSKYRSFLPNLKMAQNQIELYVQNLLKERQKHPLELKEPWEPNIVILWYCSLKAVANRYKNHEQGVGAHSDRLTL